MLKGSQPLDPRVAERLGLDDGHELDVENDEILSQYIGTMFDDIFADDKRRRPGLRTRILWRIRRLKDAFYSVRRTARSHRKWHATLRDLQPWNGFNDLISVMLTQMQHYVRFEEKHGHSTPECTEQKIASAKETMALLERMKDPDEYVHRRREEVKVKYPAYKFLVTKYCKSGTSYSGDFVAQSAGWVGIESGNDPREGYFEFIGGRLEPATSPDQARTEQLLAEIRQYRKDLEAAYLQAEVDSDKDFDRLAELLKENLYTWWG